MGNLAGNLKDTLPEFQKFLLEKKLVPERNVPFLAFWVSRFMSFGRKKNLSTADYNESVTAFGSTPFTDMPFF